MNLKDFLSNREKPPELYWSLVIEKGWVQAGIWYISSGVAEVVNISPPVSWEIQSELTGACDAALSSAVSKLPEDYNEPSKTVFGVVSGWVKGGEIQDDYLAIIKEVCTELSLAPVGFVVLPEAIAHLYKSEEGTPLSAVIVGLGKENLEVSVFKMGNLAGTTAVARSISITEDVTEGLSRFEGASPLPSRIVVYDGKGGELSEAKEELMKASWDGENKVKFLHTPKVEILLSERKVLATSLAGAAEIGNVDHVSATNLGKEEEKPLPQKEEIENVSSPDENVTAEDLGFVVGKDVTSHNQNVKEATADFPLSTDNPLPVSRPVHTQMSEVPPTEHFTGKSEPYFNKTKNLFHGFTSKIRLSPPKIGFPKARGSMVSIAVALVLLIMGIGLYLWFVPKAQVTIFVSPKVFQEEARIYFNTSGQFDESKAIIPGSIITSEASGDKTKSTTGTKLVGEKSTGSVSVVNGNGNPLKLVAGTVLTSSSGLKFVTNAEASVSGQLIPGSPGTATLSVTANDIGSQYNLPKGEIFRVGVFDKSQVAATSQADFSGGSSQQIAAVSTDDQKKLEQDLKNELSSQVAASLTEKVTENQVFVNDLSSVGVSSATFDHKVGDVADTLKLKLTLSGSAVAADKAKLVQYITNSLKSKIPQGYALRSSEIGYKFSFVGKEGDNLAYNVDINVNFLPYMDTGELAKKIAGKPTTSVENYLNSISGYSHAEIKLNPPLPGPFKTLPHMTKNIKVSIVSEE